MVVGLRSLAPLLAAALILALSSAASATEPDPPILIDLQQHPCMPFPGRVLVRFRNAGRDPVVVLRPLDGAEWGWHMPIYQCHAVDSEGNGLQLGSRCGVSGLWDKTAWPQDYSMRIPAGSTGLVSLDLPFQIERNTRYTVQLEYIAAREMPGEPPRPPTLPLPADAWIGRATSAPATLTWSDQTEERISLQASANGPHAMRTYSPPATAEAIAKARQNGLAALRTMFNTPIIARDQAALERAQMLMHFWTGIGYTPESLPEVLGQPTNTEPGVYEIRFDNGVGWRFLTTDGVITQVREIWPR